MAESKHTPGPWVPVELHIGSRSFWVAISADGKLPETEANAHLIAAAPELLTALSSLLDLYVELVKSGDCGNWNPDADDEVAVARAAIAKAGTP